MTGYRAPGQGSEPHSFYTGIQAHHTYSEFMPHRNTLRVNKGSHIFLLLRSFTGVDLMMEPRGLEVALSRLLVHFTTTQHMMMRLISIDCLVSWLVSNKRLTNCHPRYECVTMTQDSSLWLTIIWNHRHIPVLLIRTFYPKRGWIDLVSKVCTLNKPTYIWAN